MTLWLVVSVLLLLCSVLRVYVVCNVCVSSHSLALSSSRYEEVTQTTQHTRERERERSSEIQNLVCVLVWWRCLDSGQENKTFFVSIFYYTHIQIKQDNPLAFFRKKNLLIVDVLLRAEGNNMRSRFIFILA